MVPLNLLLVVMVIATEQVAANQPQGTYYITPAHTTWCSSSPCLTLSEFVAYFVAGDTPVTTLRLEFLSGKHALHEQDLSLVGSSTPTMVGNSDSFPEATSRISCNDSGLLEFRNIPQILIHALSFDHCGHHGLLAVTVRSVSHLEISDCNFQNSTSE